MSAQNARTRLGQAIKLYATQSDVAVAQSEAINGVTIGPVLTLRVEGSGETFHVLVQGADYQRFMALTPSTTAPGPAGARRVGIQSNYCPATPGQLIEPAVFALETGTEAGYPGGPDPKAIYMAVSQTEAVVVPPEVDPWLQAFAAGQLALAARSRA